MNDEPKHSISKGGKNLILLGVISIIVALATTGISLAIYHNSGDIYLDRSRPGFLPDEAEIEDTTDLPEEYNFSKTGKLTMDDIEKYLENLEAEAKALDSYSNPFSSEALSDHSLDIDSESAE